MDEIGKTDDGCGRGRALDCSERYNTAQINIVDKCSSLWVVREEAQDLTQHLHRSYKTHYCFFVLGGRGRDELIAIAPVPPEFKGNTKRKGRRRIPAHGFVRRKGWPQIMAAGVIHW
jgi:hypothetical protein